MLLFKDNLVRLMEIGVHIEPILRSNIFQFRIEFETWSMTDMQEESQILPYNGSFFDLRDSFEELFPDNIRSTDHKEVGKHSKDSKVYNVVYQVNLLPSMASLGENDVPAELMKAIAECGESELGILSTDCIKSLVDYNWNLYGYRIHYLGFFMLLLYDGMLTAYIYKVYIDDTYGSDPPELYIYLLIAGIAYPFIYDSVQWYKSGTIEYFKDSWNVTD